MLEIPGDHEVTMYHLRYHGGPRDGVVANSFRPYDAMKEPDGDIYVAKERGEACLIWVQDNTYAIDLYYDPSADWDEVTSR